MTDLWISAAETAVLPMSGSAWNYLKTRADAYWPKPDLGDQDSIAPNYAMAGALAYLRTGQTTYKTKVVGAIKAWARDGWVDSLALFRQTGAMVRAADIVGMDRAKVVTGTGETWGQFCTRIMDDPVGDHSKWDSIETTARIAPNNYGSYARDAMAALAIYDSDATAQQAVYDYTSRWLGDLSQPNPFPNPTAEGKAEGWWCATGFDAGDPEHYLAAQGVVNPSGFGAKSGANVEDASRGGAPPKASGLGVNYQLGSLDGTIAAAIMLRRAGMGDLFAIGTEAIRRNAKKVHYDQAIGTWHALFRNIPYIVNHVYGSSLPVVSAPTGRSLGYADWLTLNPNWPD